MTKDQAQQLLIIAYVMLALVSTITGKVVSM